MSHRRQDLPGPAPAGGVGVSGIAAIAVVALLATAPAAFAVERRSPSVKGESIPVNSFELSAADLARLPSDGGDGYNRLVFEKSPYLLQHARNPVDWYPWGEEAFRRARDEDKPIFLSIGYSTCHWCHVMERESFEDEEVAALLNDGFVAVKVDREERPDVDDVYMNVCIALTGSGGWPLTIVATPGGRPFFAGTYFPKEARFGRPGTVDLLRRVRELWANDRASLTGTADKIVASISDQARPQPGEIDAAALVAAAADGLASRFDERNGGFGDAPKFPTPHNYLLLLRSWERTGDERTLEIVRGSLEAMRRGGIWDHVGHGFHRYSTDAEWFVPHFEKMLYDQALLLRAFTEAWEATRDPFFAETAHEIAGYVLRDLVDPTGGFHSAEDADSEGEEGRFYLWTTDEFARVVGDDAELFAAVFGISAEGNYRDEDGGGRTGTNILRLGRRLDEEARDRGLDPADLVRRWERARSALFASREPRPRPHRDDKILAAWNGLMIASLAHSGRALDEPEHLEAAARATRFILGEMHDDHGRLLRRYRAGEASIPGFVDDYAFLAWGLIELHQATLDPRWLREAVDLNDRMLALFSAPSGALYYTADDAEELIDRRIDLYDGALPSGNAVAAANLLRIARLTGRTDLDERAGRLLNAVAGSVAAAPVAYTMFLTAVDFAAGPVREIVVVGDRNDPEVAAMIDAVRSGYRPRTVLLHRPADTDAAAAVINLSPFAAGQVPVDGSTAAAYVCENFACDAPVTTAAALREALARPRDDRAE